MKTKCKLVKVWDRITDELYFRNHYDTIINKITFEIGEPLNLYGCTEPVVKIALGNSSITVDTTTKRWMFEYYHTKHPQTVIIINGKGGVGKDTICDIVGSHFDILNVSSIDPIKDIAKKNGWSGIKDHKSRKFLSDLKMLFTEYNDLPFNYLMNKYEMFKHSDLDIMFVHIREPEEIEKFKRHIIDTNCISLLVTGREIDTVWGNEADDNVSNYTYDYTYINDKPLEDLEDDIINFICSILSRGEKKC